MFPYSRAELKQQAKASLAGKWGKVVGLYIVFCIVTLILSFSEIGSIVSASISAAQGDVYSAVTTLMAVGGPLSFITSVLVSLVSVSLTLSFLHFFDRQDQSIGKELIEPFVRGKALGTFINWLLNTIFVALWSLLFFIPGIVKSYSYAMSYYIAEDWGNQGYSVKGTEAINASKEMMRGHKWELFVLDLSFIGWYILVMITGGLASLFVQPYLLTTRAAFYRNLLQRQSAANVAYAPQGGAPAPGQGYPSQTYPAQQECPGQAYPAQATPTQAAPTHPEQTAQNFAHPEVPTQSDEPYHG